MKIYIAAPVVGNSDKASDAIWAVINTLFAWQDKDGYRHQREDIEIYNPSQLKIPNAWGMTMQEWGHCVFTVDVMELDRADWVIVCDFGRHNTAGTSWECGYAFGKGKKILIVQMPDVKEQSLMVKCCAANSITYDELMAYKTEENIEPIFIEQGRVPQVHATTLN